MRFTRNYWGDPFFSEIVAVVPMKVEHVEAIREFARSGELERLVRQIDRATILSNDTFLDVPFNLSDWDRGGSGAPLDDGRRCATERACGGRPECADAPLQVAVARLVGYRWPNQAPTDGLDGSVDADGIVCLPAVAGESAAASRLQGLLALSFGHTWSASHSRQLIERTGSKKKTVTDWLQDDFFSHHCKVFSNHPFVWHIWDGRKDGFSALVNYHRLDRAGLEKLTYTYVGEWIERQRADAADDVPGADLRLGAAEALKKKLTAILEGEPPYDIYVRWKELHEQPIGWEPDLDDGVRLNIRPFVNAGVLRSRVNVHWNKDRGKNPDGSERLNDLHYTIAEKQQAREKARQA